VSESAMVCVDRSIEVAAGVFAPGHLGELTQFLPLELVDAVLAETGTVQQRVRVLPSRVGVYFVLALCLFRPVGAVKVFGKLTAGLPARLRVRTSEKALRDLRRRLGAAPFKALFEVVAGPLAWPGTPGVCYRRWRTVAFDGCSSMQTPDTGRTRGWLGKIRYRQGWAGYPHLMLMVLCETGTRGLLGAVFGPADADERTWAARLLHLLDAGMLVLCDRGFDSDDFAAALAGTGAQFLIRATAARNPPVLARLSDGSFLSRLGALQVRVIDVDVVVTLADGTRNAERYRLITSLTDARTDPASALVALYHERWEVEVVLHDLRQGLLDGQLLRSEDQFGIEQEMWALLCLYQVLRTAMVNATDTDRRADPDRASFACAVEAARDQVILAAGITPATGTDGRPCLLGEIGAAVLAGLNPPRRLRICARKVKSGRSRYACLPPDEWRPAASTSITAIAIAIHQPPPPPALPDALDQPAPGRTTRRDQVIAFLTANPDRPWPARHIAHHLGITEHLNSFCVQLSEWAGHNHFTKTAPATYTTTQPTLTDPTKP
jgi:hypothetical protein